MPRLNTIDRREALKMLRCNKSFVEVSRTLNCHTSTISRLWKRYLEMEDVKSRHPSSQLTIDERHNIVREHQMTPSITVAETARKYQTSIRTVKALLKKFGLRNQHQRYWSKGIIWEVVFLVNFLCFVSFSLFSTILKN